MTWSLIGLKFAEYEEKPGYWGLYPELRSQAELKEKHELAACGVSKSKYEASIEKTIRALPTDAQKSLYILAHDREWASCRGFRCHWYVAAIEPKHKQSSFFGLSSKCTEWLVMIKGETIDEGMKGRPVRSGDPWMKPMSREEFKARCMRDRRRRSSREVAGNRIRIV